MLFGLCLGDAPQVFISTTPKPGNVLRKLMSDPRCINSRETTYDNRANVAADFFNEIIKNFEGARLGRKELEAEMLQDFEGSLWPLWLLDQIRVTDMNRVPDMKRRVVAIDPNGSSSNGSAQGIVVCGKGENGLYYILEDASVSESPRGWATRAVQAYFDWG